MEDINFEHAWTRVCDNIKSHDGVNGAQIDAFFSRLKPQAWSKGYLLLTADNEFIKTQIEKRFLPLIEQSLEEIDEVSYLVEIEVDETQTENHAPTIAADDAAQSMSQQTPEPGFPFTATRPDQGPLTQAVQPPAMQPPSTSQGQPTPVQTPTMSEHQESAGVAARAEYPLGQDYQTQPGRVAQSKYQNEQGYQPLSTNQVNPGYQVQPERPAQPSYPPTYTRPYRPEDYYRPESYIPQPPTRPAQPVMGYPTHDETSSVRRGMGTPPASDALDDLYSSPVKGVDNLLSSLTFETFVIGESNKLAYSMAVNVAEDPGKPTLNPLFIYGKSGLGKTHLLRAIQNYIVETRPELNVIYVDANELINDYAWSAIDHDRNKKSFMAFQNRYFAADVLLIDDVQYLQGKTETVNIVFQFFNTLVDQGKQIVLSADRAPKTIDIDERYKSRFNQGGTFDIKPPEVETKLAIIKNFIDEYKNTDQASDINIPEEVQMYVAEISSSNVRELKSAVIKIIANIKYSQSDTITLDETKDLLKDHFISSLNNRLTTETIQKVVEQYYKVSHADLISNKRSRNIVYARQIAIYLCRTLLDIPYGTIGTKFNRDHSTVMHSCNQVEQKMQKERELQDELEMLTKLIKEQ
jgi:chromosomal replication initiator protein